jgi:regulator of sigma E protease
MGNFVSALLHGDYTQWILPFLFVLTIIVLFHELGHYLVARLCGVRVTAFSLGFGKELVGFDDRNGTRWRVSALPLGGYVKFFGDENEASAPDPAVLAAMTEAERRQSLHGQPVGNRAAIAAAGPIASFLLAIVIFAGVALAFGKTTVAPRIGGVEPGFPAAAAGFQAGDIVVSIDGTPIESFNDIAGIVSFKAGVPLTVVVDRGGAQIPLNVTPVEHEKRGMLGIKGSGDKADVKTEQLTPVQALQFGAEQTWFVVSRTLAYIRDFFVGKQSGAGFGGPIKIAELAGKVAQLGFAPLLELTAMLSASVGLFNLFPIPILDGGHLLFCLIEAVKGRPISERALDVSFRIGLATILVLVVLVVGNDLFQLIHG